MNFLYESTQYTELIESLCEAELELNEYQNMSLLVNQEGINIPLPGKLGYHVEKITSKLNNIQDYFTNRLNTFLIGTDKAIKKIEEKYSKMTPEEKKSPREIKIYKQEYFDKFIKYCETQISVIKTIINKPGDASNASRIKALADSRKATKISKIGYDYGNDNKPYKKTMTAEEAYKLFKKNIGEVKKLAKETKAVSELLTKNMDADNIAAVVKERKYCSTIVTHLFRVIDKLTNETVLGCYDTILDGNKRLLVDIMKDIGGAFIKDTITGAITGILGAYGGGSNNDIAYARESYETKKKKITESAKNFSIELFVKKAKELDNNNKFEKYSGKLWNKIPSQLMLFYKKYNPVNVEIDMYNFIPADKLEEVNTNEYGGYFDSKEIPFIFATCNGDPIFFTKGKVYTHPHGTGKAIPNSYEKLANSFIEFLDYAIKSSSNDI